MKLDGCKKYFKEVKKDYEKYLLYIELVTGLY